MTRLCTYVSFLLVLCCAVQVAAQEPPAPAGPPAEAAIEAAAETAIENVADAEAPPAPPPRELKNINQVQIKVFITQTDVDGERDLGTNFKYTRYTRMGNTHPGRPHSGSVEEVVTDTVDFQDGRFDVVLPPPGPSSVVPLAVPQPLPVATRSDYGGAAPDVTWPNLRGSVEATNSWTRAGEIRRGAGLAWEILDSDKGTLEGILRGIEVMTDSDLITKPELVVADGQQATVNAGEQIPWQTVDDKGANLLISWRDIGVQMDLVPTILSDDLVQLNLTKLDVVEQLPPRQINNLMIPVFQTRSQTGVVVVPNGQTLVIGGLTTRIEKRVEKGIPIVRKIPLFGVLFRGRDNEVRNSELLVFVSPTIVDLRNMTDRMDKAINFWREDHWKNSDRIQHEIDIMPTEL